MHKCPCPYFLGVPTRFCGDSGDKGGPQWGVRGGGGRNRGVGGRFKGLDPVVPVTDPEILSSISDFYGIAQDFPLWDQIITR